MVKVIMGLKGSGKTKQLIDAINTSIKTESGSMVCIEKGNSLTYDIKPQVRLIRADEFLVDSYPVMAGFVCGIMAGDYDMLLCTTIIENGLDIPNANTIIINQAQKVSGVRIFLIKLKAFPEIDGGAGKITHPGLFQTDIIIDV